MVMRIDNNQTVESLSRVFNRSFPFLRLVFYNERQGSDPHYLKESMVSDHSLTLGEIRVNSESGWLEVGPDDTVEKIEQQLLTRYGLATQVFRRSGIVWLRTNTTDYMTLSGLNKFGEQMNLCATEEPSTEAGNS